MIKINPSSKILIIAPHPDDEVIACGGFIAKYHKQIDVLCVNSSGVKYEDDTKTAEEIAQIRCEEFKQVMTIANVNKFYIQKLWGAAVLINEIKSHYDDYMKNFNMSDYDFILVPHKHDNHPEHKFVGNVFLKNLLIKQGYKEYLKILRYELWSPLQNPNYFEDITNVIEKKRELILNYKIRSGKFYADRIIALNKYRTLNCNFKKPENYVEAFYAEDVANYLELPDIINKDTPLGSDHKKILEYLIQNNFQEKIDNLAKIYNGQKFVLYGAGHFAQVIFHYFDLSKWDIVAIADKRFEENREHSFFNIECIKPDDIKSIDCDAILILNKDVKMFHKIISSMLIGTKNQNKKIVSLIKH